MCNKYVYVCFFAGYINMKVISRIEGIDFIFIFDWILQQF